MRSSTLTLLSISILLLLGSGCPVDDDDAADDDATGDDDDMTSDDDDMTGDDDDMTGDDDSTGDDDTTAEAEIVADSVAEFAQAQGQDSWYYGYWDRTADEESGDGDYAAVEFVEMTDWFADYEAWHVDEGAGGFWTRIGEFAVHPNGLDGRQGRLPARQWAIRRWVSEVDGDVHITGSVSKIETEGDGVISLVMVDGAVVSGEPIAPADTQGIELDLCVSLTQGQAVDFAVTDGQNGVDEHDRTHQAIVIETAPDGC
jgi:hypothetical protein